MLPRPQFTLKPISGSFQNGQKHQKHHQHRPPPIRPQTKGAQIRCNVKGCRYMGDQASLDFHKKIQHFEFQHKGGISSNDLMNSNNPEDIEKWRAQRRARFPKLSNIQNTQKLDLSLECSQSQKNAFKRELQRSSSSRNNRHHQNSFKNNKRNHYKKNVVDFKFTNKRAKFEQNQNDHKKDETEFEMKTVKDDKTDSNKPMNSFKLLSNYDSDSDEAPLEVATKKLSPKELEQHSQISVSKPTENIEKIVSECMNCLIKKVEKKLKNDIPKRRRPYEQKLYYNKLTLFQKLMLQDVRENKSKLIECLKLLSNNPKSFI